MANLFDQQPKATRRALALTQLTVGRVFRLYCDFTVPPKRKYLVLMHRGSRLIFFAINSSVNEFADGQPAIRDAQVAISAGDEEHNFLRYDSYIDCSRALDQLSEVLVVNQVQADSSTIFGRLSNRAMQDVFSAVKRSRTLTGHEKRLIADSIWDVIGRKQAR